MDRRLGITGLPLKMLIIAYWVTITEALWLVCKRKP